MVQLTKQRERERKCAITSFPDWFPFLLQIVGQARIKRRKWIVKMSMGSGLVELDLVVGRKSKKPSRVETKRAKSIVSVRKRVECWVSEIMGWE